MNPAATRRSNGPRRTVDIPGRTSGQRGHRGVVQRQRDPPHGFRIGVGRHRETGLDDVHTQLFELARERHLLIDTQGESRGLLAIPEGGVEDLHSRVRHAPQVWQPAMRKSK